jgi:hypothetical protein
MRHTNQVVDKIGNYFTDVNVKHKINTSTSHNRGQYIQQSQNQKIKITQKQIYFYDVKLLIHLLKFMTIIINSKFVFT